MKLKILNHSLAIFFGQFIFLFFSVSLMSQTNDSISFENTLKDSIQESSDFNFLMVGISYTNNNIKYKTLDTEIKMPTYAGDFSYYHKSGFWASVNYANYYKANITTYETEIKIGYQHTFLDFIDLDVNYAYHDFIGDKTYEGISYNHTINSSIILNSKYISFTADAYTMYGLSNNFFSDLGASLNLDIDDLFLENDFFLFNPGISASFGTDDWIFEDFTPVQRFGRRRFLNSQGYSTDKFSYQSLSFSVPIIYSYNSLSFSLSWFYNVPSNKLKALNWKDQNGFMISVFYSPSL